MKADSVGVSPSPSRPQPKNLSRAVIVPSPDRTACASIGQGGEKAYAASDASVRARAPDGAVDVAIGHRPLGAAHAARTTACGSVIAAPVRLASGEQHREGKH